MESASNCIFCKIARHELSAEIVFENEAVVAFHDIHPKAKVHLLLIPKRHISRVSDMTKDDAALMGALLYHAKELAEQFRVNETGFKLVINNGKDGGQVVDHVHLHLLGGEKIEHLV